MLANQLGLLLPRAYGIWNWEKLWKECGSSVSREQQSLTTNDAGSG
jgi:hypothetical protein